MSIEFELKYRAMPQQLSAIDQAFPQPGQRLVMETAYYDTPDGDFSAKKITLRRRLENGIPVCTLKMPEKDGGRGEYECCCESITQAFNELCKLADLPELLPLEEKGFLCVCGARFTRCAKVLTLGETTVELALDSGCLTGGGKEIPLCEVEVELKSGNREDVCRFGAAMAEKYGLIPEQASKFRRALALAKGE